jgi:hypothetical protein
MGAEHAEGSDHRKAMADRTGEPTNQAHQSNDADDSAPTEADPTSESDGAKCQPGSDRLRNRRRNNRPMVVAYEIETVDGEEGRMVRAEQARAIRELFAWLAARRAADYSTSNQDDGRPSA